MGEVWRWVIGGALALFAAIAGVFGYRSLRQDEARRDLVKSKSLKEALADAEKSRRERHEAEVRARADAEWARAQREVAYESKDNGDGDDPGRDVVDLLRGGD